MRGIFYFQHDNNSENDNKIQDLIYEYDYYGYGIFFSLLERLHRNYGKLKLSDIKKIAWSMRKEEEKLKEIILFMIDINLFKTDGEYFYSERLLEDIGSFLAAKENGKKGGRPKKEITNEKEVFENKDKNHDLNETQGQTQNEKGVSKNENPNNNPPFDLGFEKQKPEAKPEEKRKEEKRREENKRKQQQQNKYRY